MLGRRPASFVVAMREPTSDAERLRGILDTQDWGDFRKQVRKSSPHLMLNDWIEIILVHEFPDGFISEAFSSLPASVQGLLKNHRSRAVSENDILAEVRACSKFAHAVWMNLDSDLSTRYFEFHTRVPTRICNLSIAGHEVTDPMTLPCEVSDRMGTDSGYEVNILVARECEGLLPGLWEGIAEVDRRRNGLSRIRVSRGRQEAPDEGLFRYDGTAAAVEEFRFERIREQPPLFPPPHQICLVYICSNDLDAPAFFDELFTVFNPDIQAGWQLLVLNLARQCGMENIISALNLKYAGKVGFRPIQLLLMPAASGMAEIESAIDAHAQSAERIIFDSRLGKTASGRGD